MADYTFLKQSDGQWLKVLVDSSGIIQASPNADDSDLASVLAGAATTAATASAPADATTFTAALNPATAALPGLESAADKIVVDGVQWGAWAGARRNEMLAVVPQLTEFLPIPLTAFPASTTAPTFDGAVEGGGISPLSSASVVFIGRSLAQLAKTGKGAIVFRAKLIATGSGLVAEVGLTNAATSRIIGVYKTDVVTDTHYLLDVTGAAAIPGTVTATGGYHNFMLAWNATSVFLYVDNVLSATSALTNVHDEPLFPFVYNSETTTAFVSKILYGYIPV